MNVISYFLIEILHLNLLIYMEVSLDLMRDQIVKTKIIIIEANRIFGFTEISGRVH